MKHLSNPIPLTRWVPVTPSGQKAEMVTLEIVAETPRRVWSCVDADGVLFQVEERDLRVITSEAQGFGYAFRSLLQAVRQEPEDEAYRAPEIRKFSPAYREAYAIAMGMTEEYPVLRGEVAARDMDRVDRAIDLLVMS